MASSFEIADCNQLNTCVILDLKEKNVVASWKYHVLIHIHHITEIQMGKNTTSSRIHCQHQIIGGCLLSFETREKQCWHEWWSMVEMSVLCSIAVSDIYILVWRTFFGLVSCSLHHIDINREPLLSGITHTIDLPIYCMKWEFRSMVPLFSSAPCCI